MATTGSVCKERASEEMGAWGWMGASDGTSGERCCPLPKRAQSGSGTDGMLRPSSAHRARNPRFALAMGDREGCLDKEHPREVMGLPGCHPHPARVSFSFPITALLLLLQQCGCRSWVYSLCAAAAGPRAGISPWLREQDLGGGGKFPA